jgi:hypothetical protein
MAGEEDAHKSAAEDLKKEIAQMRQERIQHIQYKASKKMMPIEGVTYIDTIASKKQCQ